MSSSSPFSLLVTILVLGPVFSHLDSAVSFLLVCIFACGTPHVVSHFSLGQISATSRSLIMPLSGSNILTINRIKSKLLSLTEEPSWNGDPTHYCFFSVLETLDRTKLFLFTNLPPRLCVCSLFPIVSSSASTHPSLASPLKHRSNDPSFRKDFISHRQ